MRANTRFSCIAAIDGRYSFMPLWNPPFITKLMPEDRCHLNGLAVVQDRIAFHRVRPVGPAALRQELDRLTANIRAA